MTTGLPANLCPGDPIVLCSMGWRVLGQRSPAQADVRETRHSVKLNQKAWRPRSPSWPGVLATQLPAVSSVEGPPLGGNPVILLSK